MSKQSLAKTLCCLLVGATAFTACVDKDYDLSDVDMTMQIGGKDARLTLPKSSTGDITLKSLFDIDEGSAIEENKDGDYYLNTEGNTDGAGIKVDIISIPKPSIPEIRSTIIRSETKPGALAVKAEVPPVGDGEPLFYYDLAETTNTTITPKQSDPISEDVRSITKLSFLSSKVNMEVSVPSRGGINILHFDNLGLRLPKGMKVAKATFQAPGQAEVTGTFDETKSIVSFNNGNEDLIFDLTTGQKAKIKVEFTEAVVADGNAITFNAGRQGTKEKGKATIGGDIAILGYMRVGAEDVDGMTLMMAPENITFVGECKFEEDIQVNKFSGSISHEIDQIDPIELNDLPDFLTEDDVTLDLYNPQIFLKLDVKSNNSNSFKEKVSTGVRLEAYQDIKGSDQQKLTGKANSGTIIFDPTQETSSEYTLIKRIYSNEKAEPVIPEEYNQYKGKIEDTQVTELATLLTKVPNTVKVLGLDSENIVVNMECEDLELPQDCNIDFEYKVYTKLAFGQNFQVVYSDTEDGLSEDMEDLEDFDFGALEMKAKASTDLPTDITLTLVPLDIDGKEIPQLLVNEVTIPAKAQKKDITLSIKPGKGYTMNDFFVGKKVKKLDGIKYKAVLKSTKETAGQALKTTQKIKLEEVQISLIGGVTIDAN